MRPVAHCRADDLTASTMTPPHDLLLKRLRDLRKDDVRALLTEGLGVPAKMLRGLKKEELVLLCSKELRSAAGSSLRNTRRGDHEFPYKQLLIDVADKLTAGVTWLSWTRYTLRDSHAEEEIENEILRMFEERARKWWMGLTKEEKSRFTDGLQSVLVGASVGKVQLTDGRRSLVTQQVIENVIQNGIVFGLSKVSIPGLTATLGLSVVSQVGWLVLLHTVGWMTGLKIAIFGIGGLGGLGGAVGALGASVIGTVLGIPSLLVLLDGPAYRKTVPTVIMLLARTRANSKRH